MKPPRLTRIDMLERRIAEMQEEVEELKRLERFRHPIRCTIQTVNAALEAGGCSSSVVLCTDGRYGIRGKSGLVGSAVFKTPKDAFRSIIRFA